MGQNRKIMSARLVRSTPNTRRDSWQLGTRSRRRCAAIARQRFLNTVAESQDWYDRDRAFR